MPRAKTYLDKDNNSEAARDQSSCANSSLLARGSHYCCDSSCKRCRGERITLFILRNLSFQPMFIISTTAILTVNALLAIPLANLPLILTSAKLIAIAFILPYLALAVKQKDPVSSSGVALGRGVKIPRTHLTKSKQFRCTFSSLP